ncbi:hypothetical protein [Spirillospora sp. CA-128828]|uniref:hypothetical protein n=1 Tax=Spirillospora sp. CA-128828 TaxID=3240033 RepID=UPI003D8FEB8A
MNNPSDAAERRLTLADLRNWVFRPCGCVVCYQNTLTWYSVHERCPWAQEKQDQATERTFIDLDPDRPRPTPAEWLAETIAFADRCYTVMAHYGPDPAADPEGAQRWAAEVRRQIPRYGRTPGGRPIFSTTDPDYGRLRCVCGFVWADDHPPGDGTGCPEHLRRPRDPNSAAEQLYRRRYAEWLAQWRRGRIHLAS